MTFCTRCFRGGIVCFDRSIEVIERKRHEGEREKTQHTCSHSQDSLKRPQVVVASQAPSLPRSATNGNRTAAKGTATATVIFTHL